MIDGSTSVPEVVFFCCYRYYCRSGLSLIALDLYGFIFFCSLRGALNQFLIRMAVESICTSHGVCNLFVLQFMLFHVFLHRGGGSHREICDGCLQILSQREIIVCTPRRWPVGLILFASSYHSLHQRLEM